MALGPISICARIARRFGRNLPVAACALALVLAITGRALAQVSSPTDDHALVEQLLKRVTELEQEVKALRASQTPAEAPIAVAAEPASSRATSEMHNAMMTTDATGPLRIRGFSDIDFRSARVGENPNTFAVGAIDLFLSSKMSERFSMVGELNFEANDDNQRGIDAERMLLQYAGNDYFNVAAGRYHTSIGYYNAAYHHGTWFQTATGRPFIFKFEDDGGLLPVHGVGVSVQGRIPSGDLGLRYVAEISNGRRSRSPNDEPVQNVVDENRHKAVNLAIIARPDWVRGLQTGFSVYRDELTRAGGDVIGETIMAAHGVYQTSEFEFLNEALFIRHAPQHAEATTTSAFYSQISRQFGRYRPYARYQYVNVPAEDAYYDESIGRLRGPSIGLRFDAAEPVALKIQFDWLSGQARNLVNGLTFQAAFTF
jgi:hypothetical protein